MAVCRFLLTVSLGLLCCLTAPLAQAEDKLLRVAVLDDAPPMAYRDRSGNLTGFSYTIAQALCQEMKVRCQFQVTRLDYLVDDLAAGNFDIAAVGLLNTPERGEKILFSKSVYRSISLWFARPGIEPGQHGIRVSTFRGSAHERHLKAQGWDVVVAQSDGQMLEQLSAGVAQAVVVPLMTSLGLQKNPKFLQFGLTATVLHAAELEGAASFGINPHRADLKAPLDKALDTILRNGVYERINTQFLPFRVN